MKERNLMQELIGENGALSQWGSVKKGVKKLKQKRAKSKFLFRKNY